MAAPTSPLQGIVSRYEKAYNTLNQYKEKYDLASPKALFALDQARTTSIDPQSQSALANKGFFFATRTFEKVFTKNILVEKIKNLSLISAILIQNSALAQNVFPGIQLAPFYTKEGLEKLRSDLESRTDYQTFKQTEWAEYEKLKAAKKLSKKDLVSLVEQQHITRASLGQYTQNKKIKRLGVKE